MGDQETNALLRFEGEDAGASSTLEKLVSLMQDAVVSVDELVAAGYKMGDITKALDVIAGGAAGASESMGELGTMTKEAALALGQANDILNTGAEAVDTFAKDSLSGAEALGALTEQTGQMAKEMDTAWFEVDHGIELLDSMRNAAVGADAVFANFDNQIGLYDETMASANDRTNAFTMTVTGAKESTTTLAQAMYDAAAAVGADADVVYELAERLGVLADAEGQAFEVAQPLVQLTFDFSAAAKVAETAVTTLTASFKGAENELAILTDMFSGSTFDMPGLVQAGYDIEKVQAAMQTLIETGDAAAAAMSMLSTNLDGFAATSLSAWDELQKVDEALLSMDNALVGTEAPLSGVIEQLGELGNVTDRAALRTLDLAQAQYEAAVAAQGYNVATEEEATYLSEMLGKAQNAAIAISDLAMAQSELAVSASSAASEFQGVGTEAETAGEKVGGANDSFGASQYLLMQLGFMAFSAASQFYNLGVTAQDTLAIIQGKTGASDAEMQQWTTTLENMGTQGGYSLDTMAQGFDLVTQAQFKGNDAMMVLQASMEFARASGSKLTDSTNLLAMSMVSFGAKASDAHTYAAILFDALANGKQNIQGLTSALGPVLAEAAQAKISFNDLVSAERDFSTSTGDSMVATREFQGLIMALAADSQLTHDQLVKLGLAFDDTKFQTLDFAGKLEYLAKYTNGNVKEFTALVGGMKDVQSTMNTLGISTKQLTANADDLGLSFDPLKYKTMDAADKLYYLLQVSGYNEATFKKLTANGVNPLNDALLHLSLNTNDVASRAKQMGLNFDEAKFSTDNLKQKLWDLWDASGHNIDAFGKLIGGSKDVNGAFAIMGTSADGTSGHLSGTSNKADDLGNKHLSKNAPIQVHMRDLEDHLRNLGDKFDDSNKHIQGTTDKVDAFDKAYGLTSKDVKANTDKVNSSLSDLSLAFTNALAKSGLADDLNKLAGAINSIAQSGAAQGFVNFFLTMFLGPTQVLITFINWIGQAATAVWNFGVSVGNSLNKLPALVSQTWNSIVQAFSNGGQSVEDTINGFIKWILSKFHFLDFQLVGGSIIPDMIDKITGAFRDAGPSWLSAITQDINSLLTAFGKLATQMYTSATHAVDQFVAGLLSRLPNVADAANQIAQKIASFLHHSSPDIGPMAGDDQWMPDFMQMMETGMSNNISRLTRVSAQVAQALIPSVGLSASSPFASQQSVAPIVAVLTQILAVLQQQRSGQAGGGVPPSVTLNNVFAGGTPNMNHFNNQLDQLQGIRFEAGLRGGV